MLRMIAVLFLGSSLVAGGWSVTTTRSDCECPVGNGENTGRLVPPVSHPTAWLPNVALTDEGETRSGADSMVRAAAARQETEKDAAPPDDPPRSLKEKASFLIGYQFLADLRQQGIEVDLEQVIRGMRQAAAGEPLKMDGEEINAIQAAFNRQLTRMQQAEFEAAAARNQALGVAFLKEYAAREGVTRLDNGICYRVVEAGDGAQPALSDTVAVHFRGKSPDGTEIFSTFEGPPAELLVSAQILGFREIVQQMKVGSRWEVAIPAELAFGEKGSRAVGPNQTLLYEIELLGIVGQ